LRDVLCEIQIASLANHIWNELEHDVVYKNVDLGNPTTDQNAWLEIMWDALQTADTAVAHLSRVNAHRREQALSDQTELKTAEDLALALGAYLGRHLTGDREGLFKLLQQTVQQLTRKQLQAWGLDKVRPEEQGDTVTSLVEHLMGHEGLAADFKEIVATWSGPSHLRTQIEQFMENTP